MNKDLVEFTDCFVTLKHVRSCSGKVTHIKVLYIVKNKMIKINEW